MKTTQKIREVYDTLDSRYHFNTDQMKEVFEMLYSIAEVSVQETISGVNEILDKPLIFKP